jgi:O-antigen/teichoic acid export membrane protein
MLKIFKNLILKNSNSKSFLTYLIGTLFIAGISFVSTPIFTRVLSITDYGILSVYQTWVNIYAVFIGFQVSGSITTARVHLTADKFERFLKSIIVLSLIGFVLVSIITLLFQDSLAILFQIESKLIPFMIIHAFGLSCATFYLTFTVQTRQAKKNAVFAVIVALLSISISILLILNMDNDKFMGRIIGNSTVYFAVILFVIIKFLFHSKNKISIEDWLSALPLCFPLIIHLLSNLIVGQSDRLFINKYLGEVDTAIYSVAYIIGGLGMLVGEAANNIWSPWYLDKTKARKNEEVNKVAKQYIMFITAVFSGIILCSPEILFLMAPREYAIGIGSLIVVSISVFFQFLYRFPLGYEQYSKNLKWVAVSTLFSAFINLLLNYYLIEIMGIIGAAIATLISYIVLFGFHELVARKIIKGYNINFENYLLGIVVVTFIGILSYLFIEYWYVRYSILIILISLLAKKQSIEFKNNN